MADMPCFDCHGEKEISRLAHLDTGICEWRTFRCFTCEGTGVVTTEYYAAWQEGRRRHNLRVHAHLSSREMAEKLGVRPVVYSAMEQGRVPWPDESAALFAVLEG